MALLKVSLLTISVLVLLSYFHECSAESKPHIHHHFHGRTITTENSNTGAEPKQTEKFERDDVSDEEKEVTDDAANTEKPSEVEETTPAEKSKDLDNLGDDDESVEKTSEDEEKPENEEPTDVEESNKIEDIEEAADDSDNTDEDDGVTIRKHIVEGDESDGNEGQSERFEIIKETEDGTEITNIEEDKVDPEVSEYEDGEVEKIDEIEDEDKVTITEDGIEADIKLNLDETPKKTVNKLGESQEEVTDGAEAKIKIHPDEVDIVIDDSKNTLPEDEDTDGDTGLSDTDTIENIQILPDRIESFSVEDEEVDPSPNNENDDEEGEIQNLQDTIATDDFIDIQKIEKVDENEDGEETDGNTKFEEVQISSDDEEE